MDKVGLENKLLTILIALMDRAITVLRPLVQVRRALTYRRYLRCEFEPRPEDIFIVSYPKSGTTLMQLMVYLLTTDGSTDFEHVGQVVPFFEECVYKDQQGCFASMPAPRCFKTHKLLEELPQGSRYIYMARNIKDVAVSYYHHALLMNSHRGSLEQFVKRFIRGTEHGSTWRCHVASGLRHRESPRVLFLTYEDIMADLGKAVRTVAGFLGIEIAAGRVAEIVQQCSFRAMREIHWKFDPRMEMVVSGNFIRRGQTGDGKVELSPRAAAILDAIERDVWKQPAGSEEIPQGH